MDISKQQAATEAEVLMELSERTAVGNKGPQNHGGSNCGVSLTPPLDPTQRALVVGRLLGGCVRPFSKWKWRGVNLHRRAETAKASARVPIELPDVERGEAVSGVVTSITTPSTSHTLSPCGVRSGSMEGTLGTAVLQQCALSTGSPTGGTSPPLDNYTGPVSYQGPMHFDDKTHSYTASLCVIMVGLPARGKTFLAHKICRLLGWHGHRAKVLNVQIAWRRLLMDYYRSEDGNAPAEGNRPRVDGPVYVRAEHFRALVSDPDSAERRLYRRVLQQYAEVAQNFYCEGGEVLVLNDDFPTSELRDEAESLFSPLATQTFFVEVVRSNEFNKRFDEFKVRDVMEYNSCVELDDAKRDFERRVDYLKSVYTSVGSAPCCTARSCLETEDGNGTTTLDEKDAKQKSSKRYVRVNNFHEVEVCGVTGYVASRIVSYVMNVTQMKVQHPIYFVRDGMSVYQCEDRIGGDSPLSPEGEHSSIELLHFVASLKLHIEQGKERVCPPAPGTREGSEGGEFSVHGACGEETGSGSCSAPGSLDNSQGVVIWTSQLYRAIQTVEKCEQLLGIKTVRCHNLNELYAGVCENLTYREVREQCPLMQKLRDCNKFSFRYPKGESYKDLVQRLEPVIMELENTDRVVVVVGHRAVLRALLTYFGSIPAENCMWLDVPYRTVWRCTYDSKGMTSLEELRFEDQDPIVQTTEGSAGTE